MENNGNTVGIIGKITGITGGMMGIQWESLGK
jgi:hypothetical protein